MTLSVLLEDMRRVLEPDHPAILAVRSEAARWQGELEDPQGAVDALTELLGDMIRVLSPAHPDAIATYNNIVYWRARVTERAETTPSNAIVEESIRLDLPGTVPEVPDRAE